MRRKIIRSVDWANSYIYEPIPGMWRIKKEENTGGRLFVEPQNINVELGIRFKQKLGLSIDWEQEQKEAELLYSQLFQLRTFPSGRTLYMGGTEIVKEFLCLITTVPLLILSA